MKKIALLTAFAAFLSACGEQDETERSPTPVSASSSGFQSATRPNQQTAPALIVDTFAGNRAAYTIGNDGSGVTVTSVQTGIVTHIARNVARLKFSDGTLVLDIEGNGGKVYRVYQAAFDRKPDMSGYAFWLGAADAGTSIESIAAGFVASDEFRLLYGNKPSNTDLLSRYYQNVLHRKPDQAGFDFWLGVLNAGQITPVQVLSDFSDSPENKAQVLADIQNGIWIPGAGKLSAHIQDGQALTIGAVAAVELSGVALTNVSAKLGTIAVTPRVVDGTMFFAVPDVAAGSSTLTVSAGGQSVELPLTLVEPVVPLAPKAYIVSVFGSLDAELAQFQSTATGEDLARIQQSRAEMARQKGAAEAMSDADLRQVARYIAANRPLTLQEPSGSVFGNSSRESTVCARAKDKMWFYLTTQMKAVGGLYLATLVPPPGSLIAAAFFGGTISATLASTKAATLHAIDTCYIKDDAALEFQEIVNGTALFGRSRAVVTSKPQPNFAFTSNKLRTYAIVETFVLDPTVTSALKATARQLASLFATVQKASSLVGINFTSEIATLNKFGEEQSKPGEGRNYAIGGISDARIQGTYSASGTNMNMVFKFKDGVVVKDPVKFKFTMTNVNDRKAVTYDATLTPVPTLVDAVFRVSSKVTEVTKAAPHNITYACTESPTGMCQGSLFCEPPDPMGETQIQSLRFVLDSEAGKVTIYYPEDTVVGRYAGDSGAFDIELAFPPDHSGGTVFTSNDTYRIQGKFDFQSRTITGTWTDSIRLGWTRDAHIAACSSTSSFTASEVK